jgi:hypothetical protein
MRSLHEVYEMSSYRTGRVCLSVRLSARFSSRIGLRIWVKFREDVMPLAYACDFLQTAIPTWRTNLWGGIDTSAIYNRATQRCTYSERFWESIKPYSLYNVKWQCSVCMKQKQNLVEDVLFPKRYTYESSRLPQSWHVIWQNSVVLLYLRHKNSYICTVIKISSRT